MANIITTLFRFREDGTGLKKVRADIAQAETTTGKFAAGWEGAKRSVVANAGTIATVLGTGLVVAGAKVVAAFQDGALAAGQFADATGASAESASQWISAAGDLGLASDDVLKAFQRLNKEIGEGDGVAEEYGLTLKRTADGAADVNETFLSAIEVINGIEDPTERARVAQELFGRSYANIAELIFQDANKVRDALESTSEQQIFDEDEIRKAREYREAMDRLQDSMQDVALVAGEAVVPFLTDIANAVADIDAALDDLPLPDSDRGFFGIAADGIKTFISPGEAARDILREASAASDDLGYSMQRTGGTARETGSALQDMEGDLEGVEDGLGDAAQAADDWRDKVTDPAIRDAFLNINDSITPVVDSMEDLEDAAVRYVDAFDPVIQQFEALRKELDQEKTLARIAEQLNEVKASPNDRDEVRRLLDLVLDLGDEYEDLPKEVITKLFAEIDQGSLDAASATLAQLVSGWSVNLAVGPNQFRINDGGNSAPTVVGTGATVTRQPTTIINNYPVAPTASKVSDLEQDFVFSNGTRLR